MQIDESQCNFPCSGDSSQACGGNSILSVYQDPTFPVIDYSTVADYQSSGCYTDSGPARTLVYRQDALDTATLTVDKCLLQCKNAGYPLAGLEYAVSAQRPFRQYRHIIFRS
jgi:WSC domain